MERIPDEKKDHSVHFDFVRFYLCIALFELLLYGSPNVIMGLFRENLTLSMDSGGSGDPYLSFGRKSFNGRESQKN